jgi:hypothetical protein
VLQGGKRQLVVDVDDNLILSKSKYRRIPRADVAEFAVQCLALQEADNRSVRRPWPGGVVGRRPVWHLEVALMFDVLQRSSPL